MNQIQQSYAAEKIKVEEIHSLKNDFKELQKFWSTESLERQDEAGQQYAKGVSYGFKLAAAVIEAKEPK
ncbi:hypothetical protein [Paenibacillus oleatilyticus]|uniref:hypothetical protein n=1 Tax=Paenibacillus oleatilyticus TaxID=2594886 RepID=UPI001C1F9280|nr:hypothetical protein [Paenibacillus oleatilyticus]MBU7320837.1 hypothetical protein [Paenibacillus oleatilyticus]